MARVERAQHRPHGERPERNQDRVLVELQPEEIVERDDRQQERHRGELLAGQPFGGELDRQIDADRDGRDREQDVGPVGEREDLEPDPEDPGEQRRMLRVAERRLARPHDHLGHVGIEVLARLRDHAVDEPERAIAEREDERGAAAARRVGKALDQTHDGFVEEVTQRRTPRRSRGFSAGLSMARGRASIKLGRAAASRYHPRDE